MKNNISVCGSRYNELPGNWPESWPGQRKRVRKIQHRLSVFSLRMNMASLVLLLIMLLPACNSQKKSAAKNHDAPSSVLDAGDLARSGNLFALDLFRQIQGEEDNMVFSPYSISSVLGMVHSGAAGQTSDQMCEVLYLPPPGGFEEAALKLNSQILSNDTLKGTEINLANAIWAQKDFSFLDSYTGRIRKYYKAPLTQLDFIDMEAREAGRQQINRWVEDNTHRRIKHLIAPGVLEPNTRMVLTNAIYFNGKWQSPFGKQDTRPSIFHISRSESKMTAFMNQTRHLQYYEDEEIQAVSLPYANERLSMMILLPREIEGWEMISRVLDHQRLKNLESNMTDREVNLSIPKFTFEMKMNLKKELSEMGMPVAFSRDADFSGMNGEKNLYVDEVIHKAFIEVSENGTEAAAATGAIIGLKSALRDEPVRFNADHPFIFLIRDHESGAILFMGRVVRPE